MKRNAHYWMWMLLVGLGAGAVTVAQQHVINPESAWLLGGGVLGVASGSAWLNNGKFSRAYDLIAGLLFSASGTIGVLQGIGLHPLSNVSMLSSIVTTTGVLGMSVGAYPAVIHTMLGFTSLSHGLKT